MTDRLVRVLLGAAPAALGVVMVALPFPVTGIPGSTNVGVAVRGPEAPPAAEVPTTQVTHTAPESEASASMDMPPVVSHQPVEQPEREASREEPAASAEPSVSDPCGDALAWVADAGLVLPPAVGYHCPSTQFSHHGAACWDASPCRGRAFIAVNLELIGDRGAAYLRHVVAHEICHILDFQSKGWTTEARADACAAAHGA